MPDTDRTADEIVTDHCALRYLEHVLDVEIGSAEAWGESQRLNRLCLDLGVTPAALKAAILAPPVRAALEAGATRVLYAGAWIAMEHGRVVTILPRAMLHRSYQKNRGRKLRYSPQLPTDRSGDRVQVGQSVDAEL